MLCRCQPQPESAPQKAARKKEGRSMKDISQIMRQAQQMQAKINEAQKKLEAMEVEGSSGGGMVKLCITGKNALIWASAIDPSLMVGG